MDIWQHVYMIHTHRWCLGSLLRTEFMRERESVWEDKTNYSKICVWCSGTEVTGHFFGAESNIFGFG